MHYDGEDWEDITSSRDTEGNIICGVTETLSPFVLVNMDCCEGITGNANCSTFEEPDISDITYIICYLYLHAEYCQQLCCPDETDINQKRGGTGHLGYYGPYRLFVFVSSSPGALPLNENIMVDIKPSHLIETAFIF